MSVQTGCGVGGGGVGSGRGEVVVVVVCGWVWWWWWWRGQGLSQARRLEKSDTDGDQRAGCLPGSGGAARTAGCRHQATFWNFWKRGLKHRS